jgi:C1A family cysteine protease
MANDKPLVAKDLAKLVKDQKAGWIVDESLKDTDLVIEHSTGAEIPPKMPKAADMKAPNLKTLITAATQNPFLYERRKALGFITGDEAKTSFLENTLIKPEMISGLTAGTTASAVDWRERWGWRWITLPKDQNGCESCWSFGATGVVESMTRIQHAVWSVRSEGDVHDGMGAHCGDGGWPSNALDWIKTNGIADPDCYPYYHGDHAWTPTPDRNGRTVKITDYSTLTTAADQKTWIDTVGPISLCFEVFHDFDGYGGGVYKKINDPSNYSRGWHCVFAVGYDDVNQCWICKNSWGQGWGEAWNGVKGYFRIGYGQASCDVYAKYGVNDPNPDPWTKRRLHNGNLYESGNGALHRNFEMLIQSGSTVKHYWRDGSTFNWAAGPSFGNDVASTPTLTGTTYNRNFECVYLTTGNRLHHWWLDQTTGKWNDGGVFGPTNAAGIPAFIQGNYGAPGNFEVVVRRSDGSLNHWWRDGGGWHDGGLLPATVSFSGATLVQSQYGVKGNLELVAVCATTHQLQHFWRDDDHGNVWHAGVCFGANVFSPPVMIEGQYGATDETRIGNFELCVAVGGAVQHWWRDNYGGTGWHMSTTFGTNVRAVAGLIESSFGFNLECIVLLNDGQIQHWWRDGAGWHAGPIIATAMVKAAFPQLEANLVHN